jgi:uncharacterized membrane protein YgcG
MSDIYDEMAGVNPATNSRFQLLANGQYSEFISNQVMLLWDPVTDNAAVQFNYLPYLNLAGSYYPMGDERKGLYKSLNTEMATMLGAGLVDPVTGQDLSTVSVAGLAILVKAAFDFYYNQTYPAGTSSSGSGTSSGASGDTSSGDTASGDTGSGSGSSSGD